jgi:hypothetical protein
VKPWGDFSLSADEDLDVEVKVNEVVENLTRGKSCIVGKLMSERIVSKETIKKMLMRWWKLSGALTFKVLGQNLFLIYFEEAWKRQGCWRVGLGYSKGTCSWLRTLTDVPFRRRSRLTKHIFGLG